MPWQSRHSRTRYDHNEYSLRVRIEVLPRKSREIPTLSGVYQIRCKQNGKIYIGSAISLQARWRAHRRDLINGVLYGEQSFDFSIVEYVHETRLLATEQFWIDKTGCTDRQIGFNLKPDATSAGEGVGLTWEGFRGRTDSKPCRILQGAWPR